MSFFKLGLLLIIIGIVLAFTATILPLILVGFKTSEISITGGDCIILFFIPICFGVGEQAVQALLVAVILAVILVVVIVILNMWILRRLKTTTIHV